MCKTASPTACLADHKGGVVLPFIVRIKKKRKKDLSLGLLVMFLWNRQQLSCERKNFVSVISTDFLKYFFAPFIKRKKNAKNILRFSHWFYWKYIFMPYDKIFLAFFFRLINGAKKYFKKSVDITLTKMQEPFSDFYFSSDVSIRSRGPWYLSSAQKFCRRAATDRL